ncbi:MAG TPA: glycosyltransferase family 2 protein [Thermoanaerobaculia bacterium]|nr:glycosyltransferase family 2 protein [Thermoanaerobaculia bacterium]HUM31180.1 glycosyltransferase family 2 protein [Thermoanaerobaculia bacterium]HXK69520.1 glycosyltransferase family 2 protein [Thermoanaerobaculia bacterium]
MAVSLVVVNYFSSRELARLLDSPHGCDEVIVVDHSESAGEAEALDSLPIDRLIVRNNSGYGDGLNHGVSRAKGDVVLLANPDLVFGKGATEALTSVVQNEKVGAAGPRFWWGTERNWLLPHAYDLSFRSEWMSRWMPRRNTLRYLTAQTKFWKTGKTIDCPVLSGAILAMRREVFTSLGGFDPKYFLFFEENDLARRLIRSGYRLKMVPEAEIHHGVGCSLGPSTYEDAHLQSLQRFRHLHFPLWYRLLYPHPPPEAGLAWKERSSVALHSEDVLLLSPHASFIPSAARLVREGDTLTALPPIPADQGSRFHLAVLSGSTLGYAGEIQVE